METRRQFIKAFFSMVAGLGLFSGIRWAFGETGKVILPKGTKRESLIQKNPEFLDTRNLATTPLKDFGTMGLTDHEVDPRKWRLSISGHVASPLSLTYDQVKALPALDRRVLLVCPGFFANHGEWKGISIAALLKMAQMKPGVTHVTVRGPKGPYENSQRFPLAHIATGRVFLAHSVNGKPLPRKHGFPLRTVAEGYYGYDWIKYVDQITAERV